MYISLVSILPRPWAKEQGRRQASGGTRASVKEAVDNNVLQDHWDDHDADDDDDEARDEAREDDPDLSEHSGRERVEPKVRDDPIERVGDLSSCLGVVRLAGGDSQG